MGWEVLNGWKNQTKIREFENYWVQVLATVPTLLRKVASESEFITSCLLLQMMKPFKKGAILKPIALRKGAILKPIALRKAKTP